MRIANRKSYEYTTTQRPFIANNLYAENINDRFYVVYSYGPHWPLWVYDRQVRVWYGHNSKYSQTTSKHKFQSKPSVETTDSIIIFPNVELLKKLISEVKS